jgi:hypothetical protein
MAVDRVRLFAGVGLVVAATLAASAADPAASRRDADLLKQKIAAVVRIGDAGKPPSTPVRTTVTEQEVNGYLAHDGADDLPAGVVSPTVAILGSGRVTGRAVVDLDRVRRELGATGLFNPLSYLRGQLPVAGTGMLHSANGVAHFQFESATIAGVPIPKRLLQQIVTYYSRSERFPSGVSLDEPFTLPARIREIQFQRGQTILIQH